MHAGFLGGSYDFALIGFGESDAADGDELVVENEVLEVKEVPELNVLVRVRTKRLFWRPEPS